MRDARQVFRDAVTALLMPPGIGALLGLARFLLEYPTLQKDHWPRAQQLVTDGILFGAMLGLFWCALGVFEQARTRIFVGITLLTVLLLFMWMGSL